jgi:hypothetical protein
MNPTLKAPVSKHLKLEYDTLLSIFAFNFKLRRYNKGVDKRLSKQVVELKTIEMVRPAPPATARHVISLVLNPPRHLTRVKPATSSHSC